jgi:hypothetical protein
VESEEDELKESTLELPTQKSIVAEQSLQYASRLRRTAVNLFRVEGNQSNMGETGGKGIN